MKIKITESVGEVFRTIEVDDPTDKVVDLLINPKFKEGTKFVNGFAKKLMEDVQYLEPETINFINPTHGAKLRVDSNQINYPKVSEIAEVAGEGVMFFEVLKEDNCANTSLTFLQVKELHSYLGKVINFMES